MSFCPFMFIVTLDYVNTFFLSLLLCWPEKFHSECDWEEALLFARGSLSVLFYFILTTIL